ncbi:uncharacterized protein L3040_000658 [Drepanopeziza brunnea f. sp. 'multigermtubi']|uniref:uncharacterized protein n=1 Tax=Drepanopeziza brunnea f. sp. 'multigermtubi' TaxID=698441 RepID=UPI00239D5463|nr:hypothetical protein L3040_000658 [Drepanopeziza brunnea f. sp. 'multigermtubi']
MNSPPISERVVKSALPDETRQIASWFLHEIESEGTSRELTCARWKKRETGMGTSLSLRIVCSGLEAQLQAKYFTRSLGAIADNGRSCGWIFRIREQTDWPASLKPGIPSTTESSATRLFSGKGMP